ncbi:acetyl-CoA C-acyltransferase, partial [Mangrovimicrobium sediminis]
MSDAYIIDAVRTPRAIGKPGKGAYSHLHPHQLAATVMRALRDRNNLTVTDIDDIIWGTSAQKGKQAGDMGRMASLYAGFDPTVSGVTLDRFCGSGITATSFAAGQIAAGFEDLAGGTEMMSLITAVSQEEMKAGLMPMGMSIGNPTLQKMHPQSHQGVCADAIASIEGISREDLDAFALESQQRAARAMAEGRFDRSLVPVYDEDGSLVLDKEEYPRPQTTAEDLAKLEPSFGKIASFPAPGGKLSFRELINQRYPDVEIQHVH